MIIKPGGTGRLAPASEGLGRGIAFSVCPHGRIMMTSTRTWPVTSKAFPRPMIVDVRPLDYRVKRVVQVVAAAQAVRAPPLRSVKQTT